MPTNHRAARTASILEGGHEQASEGEGDQGVEPLLARVFARLFEEALEMPAAATEEALREIRCMKLDDSLAADVKQDSQCVICCIKFILLRWSGWEVRR